MREPPNRARHVPGPTRGDQRRAALLSALDELLAQQPLAEIGIADIAHAAGVSRSAFYFYFPTKYAAVAALLADVYEQMLLAASDWYEGSDGTPHERLSSGFEASVQLWRERAGLMVAMLDAVGTDAEVREVWDTWIDRFVQRAAGRIAEERAAELARRSIDARALAAVLVGAAVHGMERDVRGIVAGQPPSELLAPTLIEVWYLTVYGNR